MHGGEGKFPIKKMDGKKIIFWATGNKFPDKIVLQ
jgi:hypothetical protein